MMSNKAEETKKLLKELQNTREELLKKEDELLTLEQNLSVKQKELLKTQNELVDREQKVVELQSIINRKDSLLSALKDRISSALLGFEGDGLTITQKNGKVYISLEEQLLFASGSWQVDTRGRDALSKLSIALESQQDINVLIEGHTDSIPFGGRGQIKDNWDLSVVRATAIVRILTSSSSINPERLTAAGKGEFVPIQTNNTPEGRSANRRIEIILTPKLYDLYNLLDN
jgi:chemotaxis protein MotB